MRIFVTGATGFVGSHLVSNLLAEGHDVWTLYHAATSQNDSVAHERLHPIAGDLLDLAGLTDTLAEAAPDVIYHLAGQAYPGKSWHNVARTIAINTGGTANLLEAAVAFGKPRTVVVTSAEIYGQIRPNQLPITHRSIPKPRHPYGVSKHAAGQLVRVFADRYELPVVEARPFNHIGPNQALGFVVTDFASQVAKIKLGLCAPKMLVGNLSAERDFTDVRDVVRAYQLLAEMGEAGEAYIICSGHAVSISTILNILLEINQVNVEVEYDPARMRPSDIPVLFGSYEKIQREVGWEPTIHLRQTLRDVSAEWVAKLAAENTN